MPYSVPDPTDRRRLGFTLAELVAATTALTLLILVIEPSLEVARGKSKQSVCMDRLRDIAAATATYSAADPNGHAIPVHPAQLMQTDENLAFIGAYEWGGKSGIGRNTFVDAHSGRPLGSKYGTAAGFGPARRPLNDILYPGGFDDHGSMVFPDDGQFDEKGAALDTQLRLEKYRCPADNGPPGGAHCPDWLSDPTRSSYDHFGTSYAANMFMVASSDGGEMRTNSPYLRPASRVPNPARTLSYEENIGRWAWASKREIDDCQWIGPGVDPGSSRFLRGWHGKNWTFNRAFIDAHAERQAVFLHGTTDGEGYAAHYFNEELPEYPPWGGCADCEPLMPDCPGEEGSFDYYKCIIVRGPGWQKDTLPAQPLCTGLDRPPSARPSYEDCVESG